IIKTEQEIDELEKKIKNGSNDEITLNQYSEKIDYFTQIGGYTYDGLIHEVATGLGIFELLDSRITEVSGGQRTKIALAKVLLHKPDFLVLDEPTNFIDLESVEWLEEYLNSDWKNGFIIISHDREFLNQTCPKTYELLGNHDFNFYNCNYSQFIAEKKKKFENQEKKFEEQQLFIEKEKELINRFRAGSRAGWSQSREKALGRLDLVSAPFIQQKPKFIFNELKETPDKIFWFKNCFIGRKEPLFYISDVSFHKGQKIGIVGPNGCGKSTFLKTILGNIELLDGMIQRGKGVQYVYYSQLHEELDLEKNIIDNFAKFGFDHRKEYLAGYLGKYLFKYEDIDKKVKNLSGGERTRLMFAILGMQESNLLILDEPTNHLDYEAKEALEEALKNYKKSVLFISHDRYFVNSVATHLWIIENEELRVSYGNYSDYKFKKEAGLNYDMALMNLDKEIELVLQEKLGEKKYKRLKEKFRK
ncbi:MAG: ABC-F family ATP-binding cassette domain-containing protein, partial [Candidatus Gracilibacteria bacterium]|nr:ABC-F family ATP-binding cassette domain-containing protein [Candidatus Gracilibacteria bacterium]